MSGQTFRENVAQDLHELLERHWGTAWTKDDANLYEALIDWSVERFGAEL